MAKLFEWQMENSGVPEYSVGDMLGVYDGYGTVTFDSVIKHDGTYSMKCDCTTPVNGRTEYQFSIASADIVKNDGSVVIYFYMDTSGGSDPIWNADLDGNNYVRIAKYGGNLRGEYAGNGTALTTAAVGITTGQWYKLTLRWRTGSTNPSFSFQLDDGAAQTIDTDLTAWTTTSGLMRVGPGGGTWVAYYDNLKIWDNWDGPEEGGTPSLDRWHPGIVQPHRRIVEVVPY